MSAIWHKVWRDLWDNKLRTILAALSIAVGVFALGMLFGASGAMRARVAENLRANNPAHIAFYIGTPFDRGVVNAISRQGEVAAAEGITQTSFQWKLEGETEWRNGRINTRDYQEQQMFPVQLLSGEWPGKDTLVMERQASEKFNVPVGAAILIKAGEREKRFLITGLAHDYNIWAPLFGGPAYFYATPRTVARLSGMEKGAFTRLYIRLRSFESEEHAKEVARQIQHRLELMGLAVEGVDVNDPNVDNWQQQLDGVFLVLGAMGGLSLGLSAFLIFNTMSAIIGQQVWQIGVMKTVGATFGRIIRLYLMAALIYGLLALLIAIPAGAIGTRFLSAWMLGMMDVPAGELHQAPLAFIVQLTVGLLTPLLGALIPVIGGARISAHQAISAHGVGGMFGRSWLDRLIGRIRFLPRPLALSLRNTFRRKARLALTLVTLAMGGLMFMAVMSVSTTLDNFMDEALSDINFDVDLWTSRPYRVGSLSEPALGVPGVTAAEVWGFGSAAVLLGGEEIEIQLWGVPDHSTIFHPNLTGGRALQPGDGQVILLNNKLATDEGIRPGDVITLKIQGKESDWTVAGAAINLWNGQMVSFVPLDVLQRKTGAINQGSAVFVASEKHDAESQNQLARDLREAYSARHFTDLTLKSVAQMREENSSMFNILIYLLLSMALLAAAVGSFGLMGSLSINVAERRREIGVMRATGAQGRAVIGIFVVEGMMTGALSWLFAALLSYPVGKAFVNALGSALQLPMGSYRYSFGGVAGWLAIVLALSALSSLWPARQATKVSVREALAYE